VKARSGRRGAAPFLLALLLLSPGARADRGRPAVVLCLPGLTVDDVRPDRMPVLDRLTGESSVALVNTVTRATFDPAGEKWDAEASAYLTLGMGGRGRCTRVDYRGGLDLLAAAVARLRQENRGGTRAVAPGRLGTLLRQAGRQTAALGCADDWQVLHRPILLAAMDGEGLIDRGDVSQRCLRRDPARPFGWISNADYLLQAASPMLPGTDLLWIDAGDLPRAERYAPFCTAPIAAAHRRAALRQADDLLAGLLPLARRARAILVVLAPLGGREAGGRRLTLAPLVWYDSQRPPGLLASGSTHRAGLIAMTDVADLLARSITGRPDLAPELVRPQPARTPWIELRRLQAEIARADDWRPAGIRAAQLLLLGAALLSLAGLYYGWCRRRQLLLAALPLAVLAGLGVVTAAGPAPWLLGALLAGLLLSPRVARQGAAWRSLTLVYGWFAAGLLLELLPGGRALYASPLGYSLALGARYYGIGNEWMGAITGAVLLVLTVAGQRDVPARRYFWPLPAVGALLLVVALFGAPGAGANLGGALSALAGAAVVSLLYAPRRARWWLAALAALLGVAVVGLLMAADARRAAGDQTHVARLLQTLHGDLGDLGPTIAAKWGVDWRMAQGFWGILLAIETAAAWMAVTLLRRAADGPPGLPNAARTAVAAFTLTAAAAVLFNDSGVLAGAFLMAAALPAVVLMSGEK
jgi:hypothetical protein